MPARIIGLCSAIVAFFGLGSRKPKPDPEKLFFDALDRTNAKYAVKRSTNKEIHVSRV